MGWDTLHEEFSQLLLKGKKKLGEDDEIFDKLKMAVIETCKTRHQWENKAEDSLVKLCYRLRLAYADRYIQCHMFPNQLFCICLFINRC